MKRIFSVLFVLFFVFFCKSRKISNIRSSEERKIDQELVPIMGTDLSEILQTKESKAAFDEYNAQIQKISSPTSELTPETIRKNISDKTRFLAGKWLFNYGPPEVRNAIPQFYFEGAAKAWPDLVGDSYSNVGLIPNPDDPGFPIGIPAAYSTNLAVNLVAKTRNATSCAMCHLSKTSDGRYVYGLPNSNLNPGRLALIVGYPGWALDQDGQNPKKWDPRLIERFKKMKQMAAENKIASANFADFSKIPKWIPVTHALRLVASIPKFSAADQRDMLSESKGRGPLFFVALGTEETIVLSPPSLFGIESFPQYPYDLDKTRISALLPSPDLETHVAEGLFLVAGELSKVNGLAWQVALTDFVRTFKPPANLSMKNDVLYDMGSKIYSKSCAACHQNSQGGSGRMIPAKVMKLDPKYSNPYILNITPSSELSQTNFEAVKYEMKSKHPRYDFEKEMGIRPRRLKGVWAMSLLMSTGSIDGLDHALCLEGRTRDESKNGTDESDSVHSDLCNNHTLENRKALKEFLVHFN
jgi:mono/diheme cytochrome c family protein